MSQSYFVYWLERNGFEFNYTFKGCLVTGRDGVAVPIPGVAEDVDPHYRVVVISNFGRVDGRVRVKYMKRERMMRPHEVCNLLERGCWS